MKVDHQQNHQKYLKENSQTKFNFCHYHRINNKSQQNLNINFLIYENQLIKTKKLNNKYKKAK